MFYRLHSNSRLPWTTAQEKAINRDYPLTITPAEENNEQFVVHIYLQFLWLPNSIMPLDMLVPTLLRVSSESVGTTEDSDATRHPLLVHLDPLLIGSRAISNKFHVELPQILSDGGGAGEIEETMMWFTLKHEKSASSDGSTEQSIMIGKEEEPWLDETWRMKWLDRQEKREVQIQILLQFLKLSLEGGASTLAEHARLESLMDKMSMWQLLDRLDSSQALDQADKRDWMQMFYEDIVEPQFKTQLSDLCSLFRSKIFPDSPFAEDSSRSPSPSLVVLNSDLTHSPQSALASDLSHPPKASLAISRHRIDKTGRDNARSTDTSRSRSRSLSVTLAQDSDARRAGSVGAKKRLFTREVSMSKSFRNRSKDDASRGKTTHQKESISKSSVKPENDMGVTLVAASPVKTNTRQRTH